MNAACSFSDFSYLGKINASFSIHYVGNEALKHEIPVVTMSLTCQQGFEEVTDELYLIEMSPMPPEPFSSFLTQVHFEDPLTWS